MAQSYNNLSGNQGVTGFSQIKIKNTKKQQQQQQNQQQIQQIYLEMFKMFSSDGLNIKATEFVGLGKLLKIHPVLITFDQFKKVLLRSPDYWNSKKDQKNQSSEIISATFSPSDFLRAFKVINIIFESYLQIIARIAYKNIEETNQNKFLLLTQYLKKQLLLIQQKRDRYMMSNINIDSQSDTRSVKNMNSKSVYEGSQQLSHVLSANQNMQLNTYQNRVASSPGNAYFEMSQAYTPSQISQLDKTSILDNKRLSGTDLQTGFTNQTLSNDYRGYQQQNTMHTINPASGGVRLNNQQHGMTSSSAQWRTCNSEIKSDISSRAFSSAVRTSQSKGKAAVIIPKGMLKKKFKQQPYMSVNNYLQYKSVTKSITGKSGKGGLASAQSENYRKSFTAQQYNNLQLKDTSNKSPNLTQSLQENNRYNPNDTSNETLLMNNQAIQSLNVIQYKEKAQTQQESRMQTLELNTANIKLLDQQNQGVNSKLQTQSFQQNKTQINMDQLNPMQTIDGSVSSRSLLGDKPQQSFRIRKFSRSISRQSRTESQNSFRSQVDMPDDAEVESNYIREESKNRTQKHQGSGLKNDPLRKAVIDFQDIKINNNSNQLDLDIQKVSNSKSKEQMISRVEYQRLEKKAIKYKNERNSLIKTLQSMRAIFSEFAANHQQVEINPKLKNQFQNNFQDIEKFETGNSVHQEETEVSKDEKIKQLEEELRKLKQQTQQ
eukprot:403370748